MTSARSNGYARSAKTRVPLGPSTLFSFFFFSMEPRLLQFQKGSAQPPPALSIRVSLGEKKIGIYLSTMYNYFPCSPANLHSPRSLIFHDETIFERDETRRAQSPGKGLKFNDTNLRRDINLSFEFFRSPVRARCTIF